jgi:hypothetical protein
VHGLAALIWTTQNEPRGAIKISLIFADVQYRWGGSCIVPEGCWHVRPAPSTRAQSRLQSRDGEGSFCTSKICRMNDLRLAKGQSQGGIFIFARARSQSRGEHQSFTPRDCERRLERQQCIFSFIPQFFQVQNALKCSTSTGSGVASAISVEGGKQRGLQCFKERMRQKA